MCREYRFCVPRTIVVWNLLGMSDLLDAFIMLICLWFWELLFVIGSGFS